MGSKGIKAVVVDDSGAEKLVFADEAAYRAGAKKLANALMAHPVTSQALPAYGTDVLVNIMSEAGGLPTRSFSSGRFEGANDIGGETMAAVTGIMPSSGTCSAPRAEAHHRGRLRLHLKPRLAVWMSSKRSLKQPGWGDLAAAGPGSW